MDYWLCVSVCELCSYDNDTRCSKAKSQAQWNVWLQCFAVSIQTMSASNKKHV